jgi:hypothetical protein
MDCSLRKQITWIHSVQPKYADIHANKGVLRRRFVVGVLFEPFSPDRCCLCGSTEKLTGEHKIKASALRSIFGRDPMVIGHFDGEDAPRAAQGAKSREFHFSAKLCGDCNSNRTQPADIEFAQFHEKALVFISAGSDPSRVFSLDRYSIASEPYLNVFRYFAKLMACHFAESKGPRSPQIGGFASGESDFNPIKLFMDMDPTYRKFADLTGESSFAAHGGLIVRTNPKTELPTSFESSLTLGPLRYTFWVDFSSLVAMDLKTFHQDFFGKCWNAYQAALPRPLGK